ncbi:hypothetical protein V6N13_116153 [Hibiscus sabdariffa]|uniref:Uncharacterized protein n=1 Tax=Hibiscus sabdariffa TaxID=183260 RepID=A0ABR2PBS6_9ROSI
MSYQAGTVRPYFPNTLITNVFIPVLYVDVEPIRFRIKFHGAVKQGVLPNVWTKVKLKVVAVRNMANAEIVVIRFAMDDEICPRGQVVIDQYMRFAGNKASTHG